MVTSTRPGMAAQATNTPEAAAASPSEAAERGRQDAGFVWAVWGGSLKNGGVALKLYPDVS